MKKRYQLTHYHSDCMGESDKEWHEADTVAEALEIEEKLRHGNLDLFKLNDLHSDTPRKDIWPERKARLAAEECVQAIADCDAVIEKGKLFIAKLDSHGERLAEIKADLDKLRPIPTNPATRSMMECVQQNFRALLSVRNVLN